MCGAIFGFFILCVTIAVFNEISIFILDVDFLAPIRKLFKD